MRAVVLHGPNDLRYEEVPTPAVGTDGLLIRTRAAAICGTDLRIVDGSKTRGVRIPGIIGHELAGEVVEVGREVSGIGEGDRVSVAPIIPCRNCYYCQHGMENVCAHREAIGYEFDGGLAEFVSIPGVALAAGNVFHLPDHVTFAEGAMAEPLSCCINGNEKAHVGLGQAVLIVGAGPIGLMHLQLAAAAGASEVIVSEPHAHRQRIAGEMGATAVVDPTTESLANVVMARTGGLGVDAVIMAIGASGIVNEMLGLVRKGGYVNLFAGFPGKGEAMVEANLVHYNEINVVGTSSSARRHYQKALALIAAGSVDVKGLATSVHPLAATAEAIAAVRRGEGLKAIVHPQE
jgi:L-iditol 2-dehydrogenase